jgi:hypothetical protein
MSSDNYGIVKKELLDRIRLLSHGILPPEMENKPIHFFSSKGVGAGPQGKTFYIYNKNNKIKKRMISVPIFPLKHHLSKYALKTEFGKIPGTIVVENNIILKSIEIPEFLNKKISDGSYISHLTMMHCYGTCSSVMGYGCQHFDESSECIYCEIDPVAVKYMGLPKIVSIEKLSEGLELAIRYDKLRSLTITSGTFDKPDNVAKKYIELLTNLRKKTPISIHIQHEPLENLELIKELSGLADSVGIFLEIFNEEKRKEICPGKAKDNSFEKYMKNWEYAVKCYGRGKVLTTCLLGFGVDHEEILKKIDILAEIGVRTVLLFVRCKSEKLKNFMPSYLNNSDDEILDLHINAAKILKNHGICFSRLKDSGCIGCQGCSAMMEACELVTHEQNRNE